jgi:hypothetical protein
MMNKLNTLENDNTENTIHEFHQLHESFSPAKNKIRAISVIRGQRHD